MNLDAAQEILEGIERTRLDSLQSDLVRVAVRYARIRADWALATREERMRMDPSRTAAHDALIEACNILSRAMAEHGEDASWRVRLGHDRKTIGDFACHLHAILGIRAR